MLVLSRKLNQEIIIGDGIKVRVLKIKGNTIRLGIDAPREVKIVRGELPIDVDLPRVESTTESAANVTVVFSNDTANHAPVANVIPFRNRILDGSKQRTGNPNSKRLGGETEMPAPASISFRQRLPQKLHHNRLKEIVKKLTQNS